MVLNAGVPWEHERRVRRSSWALRWSGGRAVDFGPERGLVASAAGVPVPVAALFEISQEREPVGFGEPLGHDSADAYGGGGLHRLRLGAEGATQPRLQLGDAVGRRVHGSPPHTGLHIP